MSGKTHVILDLDQTLISAEPTEEYDLKDQAKREKAKQFTFHDMDGYYIVFERPGLQKFLDFLFENFDVSVWTAASKDYATFIVDKILIGSPQGASGSASGAASGSKPSSGTKPERKLNYVFYSYHGDMAEKRKKDTAKDLRFLWEYYKLPNFKPENTLIIDDYDEVYKTQPKNCIIAPPFEVTKTGSEKDDFFAKLPDKMKGLISGDVTKKIPEINGK